MSEHDHSESGDINYWSDQCNKARRERDEARAEVNRCRLDMRSLKADADRLRALLRDAVACLDEDLSADPSYRALSDRLKAALEG